MKTPHSKLSALAELIKQFLLRDPAQVVPAQYHGTTTSIVTQGKLGIPAVADVDNYKPVVLPHPLGHNYGTQIIVYTLLAQFQDAMCEFLQSHGISTERINGVHTAEDRNRIIDRFKKDPTINVLIMSGVGANGLNLVNVQVMILYVCARRNACDAPLIPIFTGGQLVTGVVVADLRSCSPQRPAQADVRCSACWW